MMFNPLKVTKKWLYNEPYVALSYAMGIVGTYFWAVAFNERRKEDLLPYWQPIFYAPRDLEYDSVLMKMRGEFYDISEHKHSCRSTRCNFH